MSIINNNFSLHNKSYNLNNQVSFGKELSKKQSHDCKIAINDSKKALGISQMCLIAHSPSFPSLPYENTGIGILGLTGGTKKIIDFAANNGFDCISLEPSGLLFAPTYCPYDGTAFSKKVIVDLNELTTDKWANLLNKQDFKEIVKGNSYRNIRQKRNRVNYEYVIDQHTKALGKAYKNFKNPDPLKAEEIKKIDNKFNKFKKANNSWLEKDAIFQALSNKYGTDKYETWKGEHAELDKNLFNLDYKNQTAINQRINILKKENQENIDFYKFCQFYVSENQKSLTKYANSKGIKLVADRQVGFSNCDIWANQDLFLTNKCMGCPPDAFAKEGQSWGFKFFNHDKLFNQDGSLGKGGEYLKNLYLKTFRENPGGVRIDHTLGLIDPWIYPADKKALEGHRFIFEKVLNDELKDTGIKLEHIKGVTDPYGAIMSSKNKYRRKLIKNGITLEQIKQAKKVLKSKNDEIVKKYSAIFEKIIIPAAVEAEKERSPKDRPVKEIEKAAKNMLLCEDLGIPTDPLLEVMKKLELSGMRHARWADAKDPNHLYREGNTKEEGNWRMIEGSDDAPYAKYLKYDKDSMQKKQAEYVYKELVEKLPQDTKDQLSLSKLKNKNNPWPFIKAKAARILLSDGNPQTSNKAIFTLSGLLGGGERWNTPGTQGPHNWTARIHSFFDKTYYNKTLPENKGISIVDSLLLAMQASGKDFVRENQDLIKKLKRFSKIIHQ